MTTTALNHPQNHVDPNPQAITAQTLAPGHAALLARAHSHFEQHLQLPLDELLQAIDSQHPAGYCVKSTGTYQAIRNARRADDPRLPQGPWQHELKRADWAAVSHTAAQALQRKSKDLQLAAWLLEAQIHQCGFAGIAPTLVLIDGLLRQFWSDLHPQEAAGSTTHRANILHWINHKLLPAIKQQALTEPHQEAVYSWADREAAVWREHQPAGASSESGEATLAAISTAITQSATPHYLALQTDLRLALQAIQLLTLTVHSCFGDDKPSLSGLSGLLKQILGSVETELQRRGVCALPLTLTTATGGNREPTGQPPTGESEYANPQPAAPSAAMGTHPSGPPGGDPRTQAYAQLEQALQTLLRVDPHSPAPYLVQRAVQWGRLSTAELYKEVFVTMGGQLNIFELLGVQASPTPTP